MTIWRRGDGKESQLGVWPVGKQYYLAHRKREGIHTWISAGRVAVLIGAEGTGTNPLLELGRCDSGTIWRTGDGKESTFASRPAG